MNRRDFMKTAVTVPVALAGRRGLQSSEMVEVIYTLQPGDELRVVYPEVQVVTASPPPSENWFIIWPTDVHIGRGGTYNAGEIENIFAHLFTIPANAMIISGDIVEDATPAQFAQYTAIKAGATMPVYELSGNHDALPGTNDYTNYNAAGLPETWAFTLGSYRLIGFRSHIKIDQPYQGYGWVDQASRDFITGEIANLNGLTPLLFSHFPLDNGHGNNIRDWYDFDAGQAFLYNALGSNGRYFSGHRHIGMIQRGVDVQGSCLAYNYSPLPPGYMILNCTDGILSIDRHNGRTFEWLETIVVI